MSGGIELRLISTPNTKPILYVEEIFTEPRHFQKLFTAWQAIQQLSPDQLHLTIEFSRCTFLAHNGVAFLGGLARLIEHQGGHVVFDWDTLPRNVKMNLAQNGFLCDFGQLQNPWDGNSIPYRCDHNPDKAAVADYLRYKWLGKGWVNISPGLQDAITGQALELYCNAFEHSQSPVGVFSCGQHYPNLGVLQLTVVDFGIGIANNVRSLPQNANMSASTALEWAFQAGTTTTVNGISRGLGLNLLQEFIRQNHGELMIFSNDGWAILDDNGIRFQNNRTSFSGTLVNIVFKCDESFYCLRSEVPKTKQLWF